MAHLEVEPGTFAVTDSVRELLLLLQHGGVSGRIGEREVSEDADDLHSALGDIRTGGRDQRVPVGAVGSVAGETGVDLELHPRCPPDPARRFDDRVEFPDRWHPDVDAGHDGPVEVGPRRV